jgi:hypothetical protein
MNRQVGARIAALCLLLAAACSSSHAPQAKAQPSAPVHKFVGGCAGTVLSDAEPPKWSQGGWKVAKGTAWPVPWALGSGGEAVAFVFATELVAGGSPRIDGTSNKVLWVAKDDPPNFVVEGLPPDKSGPVIRVAGGPSTVDVPSPGCWTFHLTWGPADHPGGTVINLEALPVGSLPTQRAT